MQNIDEQYSPGIHKLIHHLEHLNTMLSGKPCGPIHVSVWPTIRCQCRCSFCCCRNTENRESGDLDENIFRSAVDVLSKYGTKAIEFSGGGEPLLWKPFNKTAEYINEKGIKLSLITNGLELKNVPSEVLSLFSWVRVSIQSIKHARSVNFSHVTKSTRASASYIISKECEDFSFLKDLYNFSKENNVIIRIAVQRPSSENRENFIKNIVGEFGPPLFFSLKEPGTPLGCYMAWVRAAIDWNGNFLPCPSMQLSSNSEGKIPETFALCNIKDLEKWIKENPLRDLGYKCSFCNCGKDHNDFIHKFLQGVEDVEFV